LSIFKLVEATIGSIVGGLIVFLIIGNLPSLANIGFPQIDLSQTLILVIIILGIGSFGLIYGIKGRGSYSSLVSSFNDYKNYINVIEVDYAKVKWQVGMPFRGAINPSQPRAKIPPRCPKCLTELEQKKSQIRGYVWNCVSCGFKTKNNRSYWDERGSVEKIARRTWEESSSNGAA